MAENPQTQDGAQPKPATQPDPSAEPLASRRYGENKSTQKWLAERKDQRAATRKAIQTASESTPQAESLEPEPEPTTETSREEEQDTQVSESADAQTTGETEVQEAEVSQEQVEEGDFPETLTEFAEAVGVDPKDFLQGVTTQVKVNGEMQDVSIADMLEAYSSKSERDRLASTLVDERKAIEAETQKQATEWQNRIQQADAYLAILQSSIDLGPSEEQLAQLLQTDEIAYLKARADRDSKVQKLQAAVYERQQMGQQAQQEALGKQAEYRKKQQDGLMQWKPDLQEPSKLNAFEGRLRSNLQEHYDFSGEEVQAFFEGFDLRQLKIVDDAIAYRELKSKEKPIRQKLHKLPKIQKGGQKRSEGQLANDKVLSARNRLKSTGSKHDGVKLLQARRAQRNQRHGGSQ
ncbi:MAG: hypothetical protein ACR2RF_32310 [Geminicoccaceae bacterium]